MIQSLSLLIGRNYSPIFDSLDLQLQLLYGSTAILALQVAVDGISISTIASMFQRDVSISIRSGIERVDVRPFSDYLFVPF